MFLGLGLIAPCKDHKMTGQRLRFLKFSPFCPVEKVILAVLTCKYHDKAYFLA